MDKLYDPTYRVEVVMNDDGSIKHVALVTKRDGKPHVSFLEHTSTNMGIGGRGPSALVFRAVKLKARAA